MHRYHLLDIRAIGAVLHGGSERVVERALFVK